MRVLAPPRTTTGFKTLRPLEGRGGRLALPWRRLAQSTFHIRFTPMAGAQARVSLQLVEQLATGQVRRVERPNRALSKVDHRGTQKRPELRPCCLCSTPAKILAGVELVHRPSANSPIVCSHRRLALARSIVRFAQFNWPQCHCVSEFGTSAAASLRLIHWPALTLGWRADRTRQLSSPPLSVARWRICMGASGVEIYLCSLPPARSASKRVLLGASAWNAN